MTQERKRRRVAEVLGASGLPRLFRALADPNRVAILAHLARCRTACSVSDIAGCCPVDLSVVSRHLAVLREAGVLAAQRSGKQVLYSVNAAEVARALRAIADAIESCCPPGGGAERRER